MTQRLFPWPRATGWLNAAGDALVSVVFPGACRLCERLLTRARRIPICEECLDSFTPLCGQLCEICGQPTSTPSFEETDEAGDWPQVPGGICRSCELRTYAFDCARSYAFYEGSLVRAVVMLKFEPILPLATWFAEQLTEVAKREGRLRGADVVVPVPLHRRRARERGYNQAHLVAKPLAQLLGLPCRPGLLVRTRERPNKHILSLRERWESVRGAFATAPGAQVDNMRVLLVDDVLTTGATLDACAKVLRKAGAKSVIGLTVARAARHPVGGSGQV